MRHGLLSLLALVLLDDLFHYFIVTVVSMSMREKMRWYGLMWLRIGTSERALVNTVMNLRVP
jgi:hypothetical protein